MIRFWSIARNTFVQTVREPIFGVLILATFAVLLISATLAGWTMDPGAEYETSDQRMMEDLGLSTLLIAGLLVAAFSASSALSREIEDRTALTVIAKPVSRATFVLGKFAGVTAAVTVAYYLISLVFLMTVRHGVIALASMPIDWPVIVLGVVGLGLTLIVALAGNVMFGWDFASTAIYAALVLLSLAGGLIGVIGKGWRIVPFATGISPQLAVAIALTFLAVLVFTAVAVAASTRLGQLMTLLVCAALLAVGYLFPFLFKDAPHIPALAVLSWISPNLRLFDAQTALSAGKQIPGDYMAWAALYTLLYVGAVLAVGIALFQTKPLEAQEGSSTMPSGINLASWGGRAVAVALALGGAIMLSLPQFQHPAGLAICAGLLAGGVGLWLVASAFGRGARWAYWAAMVLGVLVLAAALTALIHPALAQRLQTLRVAIIVAAAVAAGLVGLLVMPKTRLHFTSVRR